MEKQRIHVGGKFSFKSLPQKAKDVILNKLAEKNPELKSGAVPGLLINGEPVTTESVKKLEITPGTKKPVKITKEKSKPVKKKRK